MRIMICLCFLIFSNVVFTMIDTVAISAVDDSVFRWGDTVVYYHVPNCSGKDVHFCPAHYSRSFQNLFFVSRLRASYNRLAHLNKLIQSLVTSVKSAIIFENLHFVGGERYVSNRDYFLFTVDFRVSC